MTHIYAFGSLCRGDVSVDSDVDLLAVVDAYDDRFDPEMFSVYTYARLRQLWHEGNPFAWHLSLEARLLFSSDSTDFLASLGRPETYRHVAADCEKFQRLFQSARSALNSATSSTVYEFSTIFLSIRNVASCYALGVLGRPDFSRNAALHLGANSVPLSTGAYGVLERARLLSTRARGPRIAQRELESAQAEAVGLDPWFEILVAEARKV